jgi:hypothetical protein
MEQLGLKDSSRDLQMNCAISFCFYIYIFNAPCICRKIRYDWESRKILGTKQRHRNFFHPSHRIFGHMHETLNVDKKIN